jgi:galactose mutarotase-like enzyme
MSDTRGWLLLGSSDLAAQIDPLGAQLSVLRDRQGHDLLWDGNPAFWNGRAPLLFPIVGALVAGHYRIGATSYALPRHGFARGKAFEVLDASSTSALLRLCADAQTLAVYPFLFELQVHFEITQATLLVTTSVQNRGDTPMPASLGYHPAFRWPLPFDGARERHTIQFDFEEPEPIRRLDAAGLLRSERISIPVHGTRLLLDDALFQEDALILDAVRSRGVSYGADAGPRLVVKFPDSPYLAFWSKPRAPFICIEPWHGIADPVGFRGDFTEKPGVFMVPPGAERAFRMHITLVGD